MTSPFLIDDAPRPALLAEALAILAAIEAAHPDLVPVVVPAGAGRRVVFMYLDDAIFLRLPVDDSSGLP